MCGVAHRPNLFKPSEQPAHGLHGANGARVYWDFALPRAPTVAPLTATEPRFSLSCATLLLHHSS